MNRKSIKIIVISVVVFLACVAVVSIPTRAIIKNNVECSNEHAALMQQKQTEINELNKLEIFSDTEPKQAFVDIHGGCGSLNPLGITISKSYDGNRSGNLALESVRTNLQKAGYTITSENFGSEGCKAIYRTEATNERIKLYVAISQKSQKITGCTNGRPTGLSEEDFRGQTIDSALVTPKCGSELCL